MVRYGVFSQERGNSMLTFNGQHQGNFRPATAKLVVRLLAPLLESGTITSGEYDQIAAAMKSLTKASSSLPMPPLKLITAKEAADMLSISFAQFRVLEKEGAFPFQRKMIGNKTVRYRNWDVLRYLMYDDKEMMSRT